MSTNLAILSPSENAYSETFIQGHRKLPFNISFYFGGSIPTHVDDGIPVSGNDLLSRIRRKFTPIESHASDGLKNSFRKKKIAVVLAEYGTTGADSLSAIRELQLPLVVHFHGFDASITDVIRKYEVAYREMFAYASAVVVVSNVMRDALIKMRCAPEKIHLATYGPKDLFFNIFPRYDSMQLVAVGRFVDKKAPLLTLRSFKKVLEYKINASLVMVGDGPLLEDCKNYVKDHNLENVTFAGVKNENEIQELFSSSCAFVQHSITAENGDSEGTPVAILEAQAAGLPVISTYHAGIPDVVQNNTTGLLVEEGDVDGMAACLIRILTEDGLAASMGTAGRKRIAENFTHEQYLSKLTSIIDTAVSNKKKNSG